MFYSGRQRTIHFTNILLYFTLPEKLCVLLMNTRALNATRKRKRRMKHPMNERTHTLSTPLYCTRWCCWCVHLYILVVLQLTGWTCSTRHLLHPHCTVPSEIVPPAPRQARKYKGARINVLRGPADIHKRSRRYFHNVLNVEEDEIDVSERSRLRRLPWGLESVLGMSAIGTRSDPSPSEILELGISESFTVL